MKANEWIRLKEITDETNTEDMKVGDLFLMGTKVIEQRENKIIGDQITYYRLLNKKDKGIEYIAIYDRLEEGF